MALIKNVWVVLILLIMSRPLFCQEKDSTLINRKLLSFGVGLDFLLDNSDKQFSFSLSLFDHNNSSYLGARALLLASIHDEVWKYNNLFEISPLYGKGIVWKNSGLLGALGVALVVQHLSGGVRSNEGAMFSSYTYSEPVTNFAIGLPAHVQFLQRIGNRTGISLLVYANLNKIESFFGGTLNVLILL